MFNAKALWSQSIALTIVMSVGSPSHGGEGSPASPRAQAAAEAARTVPRAASADSGKEQTDKIRVQYRTGPQGASGAGSDPADVIAQTSAARVQSRASIGEDREELVLDRAVSDEELQKIVEDISRSSRVEYAVAETIDRIQQVNDPEYGRQWHYTQGKTGINLPNAWKISSGSNVVVAVLDTGILPHKDIKAQILPGYDMVRNVERANDGDGRDSDASDPGDWCVSDPIPLSSWHGLHVSGTVAAITNNKEGGAGIAHRAKILPVRVLGQCGGSNFDIADGIRWAAGLRVEGVPDNPTPAQVINLSLGGTGACDQEYAHAIREARQQNVTIVVAAGNNDGDAADSRPANCDGVITVSATNRNGARAKFSSRGGSNVGAIVKIAAPGGEISIAGDGIYSTLNDGLKQPGNDSYEYYQGTSMAAPHVAGVVALIYAVHPAVTPDEILSILQRTSQPFPSVNSRQCTTRTCGAGIIDAEGAVSAAVKAATQRSTSSRSATEFVRPK